MSTSVYILKFSNRIKIGRTCNVEKRIRTIENASGEKCVDSFAINTDGTIEKIMHKELKNHRTVGEYFEYPFEKAKEILIKIADTKIKTSNEKQLKGGYTVVTNAQKIRMALAYKNISESELARKLETTPQAFHQRMKTDKFSSSDLEKIAKIIGAEYLSMFKFPDGTTI